MILVLMVAVIVVVAVILKWAHEKCYDTVEMCLGIVAAIFTMVVAVLLVGVCVVHLNAPGAKASNQQRYEALIYKAETEAVRDEFGVLNKEYIDEIQAWNEDLAKGKVMQDDFWFGIFYPNYYDEFEFINLDEIVIGEQGNEIQ